MIIVCDDCVRGKEEADTEITELNLTEATKCYRCCKEFTAKDTDKFVYVIDEPVIPAEYIKGLEINSCQNESLGGNMELHEYVRDVLESQDFDKHYPTLWELFDDVGYEDFEIPDIECRRCGRIDSMQNFTAIDDWTSEVGVSSYPISRFNEKIVKLHVLEEAWPTWNKPQPIFDSKLKMAGVKGPLDLCGIYSELEMIENEWFFEDECDLSGELYVKNISNGIYALNLCSGVKGRYLKNNQDSEVSPGDNELQNNLKEEIVGYSLRPGHAGIYLWVEKRALAGFDDFKIVEFFQDFINRFLSCFELFHPNHIGLPRFCLDGRPILYRSDRYSPWTLVNYKKIEIDIRKIFEEYSMMGEPGRWDAVGVLTGYDNALSLSWKLLADAIAQFRMGRYREGILNACSAIETEISPELEQWLKRHTFSGSHFEITDSSLKDLKSQKVPDDILTKLSSLKERTFSNYDTYVTTIRNEVGELNFSEFESLIMKRTNFGNKEFREHLIPQIIKDLSNPARFEIYFLSIASEALSKLYNIEEQCKILEQLKAMNSKRNKIVHYGEKATSDEAREAIYAVGKILRAIHHHENEQFYERMKSGFKS